MHFSVLFPYPACSRYSGTRSAARSKPSITSWRAVNASCTCNSIPIGRLGLIRKGARRGNENRRQPMEVLPFTPSTSVLSPPFPSHPKIRGHQPSWATTMSYVSRSRSEHMSRSDRCSVVWMRYSHRLIKKMRSINEGLSPETLVAPLPPPCAYRRPPPSPLPREFNYFELCSVRSERHSNIVLVEGVRGCRHTYTNIFIYLIFIAFIYLIWNAILWEIPSRKSFEGCPGFMLSILLLRARGACMLKQVNIWILE